MFLDHIVADDIRYTPYDDHCQTRPLDNIVVYFGWLAYGTHLTYLHLPERVTPQFGYLLDIPRDPSVNTSPTMVRRDFDEMYNDFYNISY